MREHKYLIVGGGMTADAAVNGIRQIDTSGRIGIISDERHSIYNRPPLSKALWKGAPLETVWRKTPTENVDIYPSTSVKSIDSKKKFVTDEREVSYSYDKLLIATGGRVRRLPFDIEGIVYFRTLDDYQGLRALAERGQAFAVIGGGFIGSEIAAALALNKKSVTMIFPEPGIGSRVYPPGLSAFLNTYYQSKGVRVLSNDGVASIKKDKSEYVVNTTSGHELRVDGVVAGIGIQPNVELARSAGVQIDNGIVVNQYLITSKPDIYAAGDVANFFSPALEKRIRVEHEDNALTMGETAGKNMAGKSTPYHHLPFFYSDLFDQGFEAVGEIDARLETVEDWKEEFKEGVIYYLQNDRIRGVLLWNTWGQVDPARSLIGQRSRFDAKTVRGLLPVSQS